MIIRFAGDSGDGMQLTGSRFTDATAVVGNDLATLPNFPAEIRAPAGTLAGVSAFQIHFASRDILTPGDHPDVLVAMNPAALKANLRRARAGRDDHRQRGRVHQAQPGEGRLRRQPARGRHAGGLPRAPDPDEHADHAGGRGDRGRHHPRRRPRQEPVRARRHLLAVRAPDRRHQALDRAQVRARARRSPRRTWPPSTPAGRSARRPSCSTSSTASTPATDVPPGTYRNVNGTTALSLGLIAASVRSGLPLVLASYPITPASELLHELSQHASIGVSHDPGRGRDRRRRDGARALRSAASSG